MDKMQLLKSVIGTLGIYLIFSVFTVIFCLLYTSDAADD